MKYKNLIISGILVMLLMTINLVVAQGVAEQYPSQLTIFFNNLKHNLGLGVFSVVGDDRSCGTSGGNPHYSWSVGGGGESFMTGTLLSGNRPGSVPENSIIDIFTNGWTPFLETKNFAAYGFCGTGPCNLEIYICPEPEPSSQSDCASGEAFTSVSCPSWSGTSFYRCPTEKKIPYYFDSYNYCAIGGVKTCWYKTGTDCYSRTYNPSLFPKPCEEYTYNSLPLFSEKSDCLGSACVPLWETGSWSDCVNNQQTRTVTDSNDCSTNAGKPATTKSCETPGECLANGEVNLPGGKDCCSGCQKNLVCVECVKETNDTCVGVLGECKSSCTGDWTDIGKFDCSNKCCKYVGGATPSEPPKCIDEQGIFYTNGYAIIGEGNFKFLGYASETTSGDLAVINTKDLQGIIPGLSAKYYENRATTCCGDLKALFEDEKTFQYSRTEFDLKQLFVPSTLQWVAGKVKSWFGVETEDDIERISVTYSIYKCVPEEEVGFCLDFAHGWLNQYTKTDDCQTNTIILLVLIVFIFIIIARFAG